MNKSSYVDTTAAIQVIGNLYNNPNIFDEADKYNISDNDFVEDFHKIVIGAMYNIHISKSDVTLSAIVDYLSNRPKFEAIFKNNKGIDYIQEASSVSDPDTFNYYYNRLKKFTLLRAYADIMDVTFLYDPNEVLNIKKRQEQEDWLDSTSLVEIADIIDNKISKIRFKYVEDDLGLEYQAGDGAIELIESLEQTPEVGIPMYGALINAIVRGARLKKVYLRSGSTGLGKSRTMVADACCFACNKIYDEGFGWIKNGTAEPTLFITTEQEKNEVQTMMLAFLSNVNEDHILNGIYINDERERVIKAAEILKESPFWIEELPDFSLQDIENKIKKHIREHEVKYVVYDYLHTSIKILEEITHKTNGIRLREDNILFMIATRLKDIANNYGIFILTGTQLNSDYVTSSTPDQNLLRGSKAIGDKMDAGMILLTVTQDDLFKIEPILKANPTFVVPTIKISVYKNRRGKYKGIYLWCEANLGTCRVNPMFITTWAGELILIEDAKIIVEEEPSVWDKKEN